MDLPLHRRLLDHIRTAGLFTEPGRALIAVSGGPDSVALALLLQRIASKLRLDIVIGHVDHGIQPASATVAAQVKKLADRIGVPVLCQAVHLGPHTSETKARQARYDALRAMQQQADCHYLVTAHHADDQIETVMLRFLRGSGLAGLSGIPATGPCGLVRPLLGFSKDEIGRWLRHGEHIANLDLDVHEDPSNRDPTHDRSWVRSVLLPLVNSRFEGRVDTALLEVAANASDDRAAWSALLRETPSLRMQVSDVCIQVARDTLHQYDPRLSHALLRAAAREVGCVLGPDRARRVWLSARHAPSGRTFELGHGWVLETVFDDLRIRRPGDIGTKTDCQPQQWGETEEGEVRWGGWLMSWCSAPAMATHRASMVTWVTYGSGGIRVPQPGDRIRPLAGQGRRKVSRLLMEGKVPWPDRSNHPVLTRGNEVLWLPGICRSDLDVPQAGEKAIRIHASRC